MNGLTEQFLKVKLKTEKHMVRVKLFMQMGIYMKEILMMIKQMVMEYLLLVKDKSIKVNGYLIFIIKK